MTRIQINASIDGNFAKVEVITQKGKAAKGKESYTAMIHSRDYIEIGNEFEVPMGRCVLIERVLRDAMDSIGE